MKIQLKLDFRTFAEIYSLNALTNLFTQADYYAQGGFVGTHDFFVGEKNLALNQPVLKRYANEAITLQCGSYEDVFLSVSDYLNQLHKAVKNSIMQKIEQTESQSRNKKHHADYTDVFAFNPQLTATMVESFVDEMFMQAKENEQNKGRKHHVYIDESSIDSYSLRSVKYKTTSRGKPVAGFFWGV